jgi:hypothetical protein
MKMAALVSFRSTFRMASSAAAWLLASSAFVLTQRRNSPIRLPGTAAENNTLASRKTFT